MNKKSLRIIRTYASSKDFVSALLELTMTTCLYIRMSLNGPLTSVKLVYTTYWYCNQVHFWLKVSQNLFSDFVKSGWPSDNAIKDNIILIVIDTAYLFYLYFLCGCCWLYLEKSKLYCMLGNILNIDNKKYNQPTSQLPFQLFFISVASCKLGLWNLANVKRFLQLF